MELLIIIGVFATMFFVLRKKPRRHDEDINKLWYRIQRRRNADIDHTDDLL